MKNELKAFLVLLLMMLPVFTGFAVFAEKGGDSVRTDLKYLLPRLEREASSAGFFTDRLSGEVLFTFSALSDASDENVKNEVRSFTSRLKEYGFFRVRDFSDMEKTGSFLFSKRYALGADEYLTDGVPDEDKLRDTVLGTVYSPFGGATAGEMDNDPFFTMRHYVMRQTSSRFGIDGEGFTVANTEDGRRFYVVSASFAWQGLSQDERTGFYDFCRDLRTVLAARHVDFRYTGAFFFTEEASSSSRNDIGWIGIGSAIMLIVIMLGFFRSVKPLFYAFSVLSLSMLSAFGAVLTVFGGMHVISLAMGATLAGVSFDYVLHVLVRRARCTDETPETLRRMLRGPLILSLITSITAYGVTAFTGLNVLRELGLFASVVLLGTFLLSCYCLSPCRLKNTEGSGRMFNVLGAVDGLSGKNTKIAVILFVTIIMSAAVFLLTVRGADDDVGALRSSSTELADMDREISRTVNGSSVGRWLILEGTAQDDVYETCERFISTLTSEEKKDVEAPCLRIPSARSQAESIAAYKKLYPALKDIYGELGIKPDDDRTGLKEAEVFKPQDMPGLFDFMTGDNALLIRVNADNPGLMEKVGNFRGFYPLDRRKEWSDAFGLYRTELERVLVTALIIIFAAGGFFLRRRILSAAVLPILSGLSAGIAANYIITGCFNLFSVTALFVVTGLGADYCVFIHALKDSDRQNETENTLTTLSLAWISTEVSCGMLLFSGMPAIVTMGAVIFCGLLCIPVTAVLLREH